MTAQPIRWGILGTGDIAGQFAADLLLLPEARIQAVGSRSQAKSDAFGDAYGIPNRHASYEALAADPEVDIIYIATPHAMHCENALLCMDHGKAVLCEKPLALNRAQCEAMVAKAREKNCFFMEAMWTYCFPAIRAIRALLAEGALGEIQFVRADFFFNYPYENDARLYDPALGGGALLDVGIYPLAIALLAYGLPPVQHTSLVTRAPNGVDLQNAFTLAFPNGGLAQLASGFSADIPEEAIIAGTKGTIAIPARFFQPSRFTLHRNEKAEEHAFETIGLGYAFEALEAMRSLRAGLLESPDMPWATSLLLAEIMDSLRSDWGLRYPSEA
jgi:predicted dehydrogenase